METVTNRDAIVNGWFELSRMLGALDVMVKHGSTPADVARIRERLEIAHGLIRAGLHGANGEGE